MDVFNVESDGESWMVFGGVWCACVCMGGGGGGGVVGWGLN